MIAFNHFLERNTGILKYLPRLLILQWCAILLYKMISFMDSLGIGLVTIGLPHQFSYLLIGMLFYGTLSLFLRHQAGHSFWLILPIAPLMYFVYESSWLPKDGLVDDYYLMLSYCCILTFSIGLYSRTGKSRIRKKTFLTAINALFIFSGIVLIYKYNWLAAIILIVPSTLSIYQIMYVATQLLWFACGIYFIIQACILFIESGITSSLLEIFSIYLVIAGIAFWQALALKIKILKS